MNYTGCERPTRCHPSCACNVPLPKDAGRGVYILDVAALGDDAIEELQRPGAILTLQPGTDEKIARLEELVYVPGLFRCAKCGFELISKTLYLGSGTVGANNKPRTCPNCDVPLWRVSERDYRTELFDRLLKDRNETLELAAKILDDYADCKKPCSTCSVVAALAAEIRGRKTE